MKFIRNIASGKATLLITAAATAVYLFATFGNENPLSRVSALVSSGLSGKLFVVLVTVHFLIKGVYGIYRNSMRYAASALFCISASVVIASVMISTNVRQTETKMVSVSESIGDFTIESIQMELPARTLSIGESSELVVEDPQVVIGDDGGVRIVRPFPFINTGNGFLYINDVGLSPQLEIDTGESDYELSKMQLLPPGREDVNHLTGGLRASVSIVEEKEFKKGRLLAREYNLQMPRYRVLIKRENKVIFDETVKEREASVSGDITVRNNGTLKWAELVYVRDSSLYGIYIGMLGIVISICIFPFQLYVRIFR